MQNLLVKLAHILARPATIVGAVIIALGAAGGAWYLTRVSPSGDYSAATETSIQSAVNVSGAVKAAQSTTLSFQTSGAVAAINIKVGDHVYAGETLVTLAGGTQSAAFAGAQANLEAAQANLASLQAGTRPQVLAVDQANVRSAVSAAYIAADSAVHITADQLFTNPRTNPQLMLNVPDSTLESSINNERLALEPALAAWNTEVNASGFATADPTAVAADSSSHLTQVASFLGDLARALSITQPSASISASALLADETAVGAARASVSSTASALTAATGALTLAEAGSTATDISAAQAQVDAAQAAVASAKVGLGNTVLVAPVSGTITEQDANPGETVAPGMPLISMIADGAYQADAEVSQSDVAALKVGQSATATFDAYPGVSFPATVTTVAPASTDATGAPSYTVTVTFSAKDPRVVAGATAHLSITTGTVTDALVVPGSAVITDDDAKFVYVKSANGPVKTPVTTGIVGADGSVQILSGLSAGQEVLTFGASANS